MSDVSDQRKYYERMMDEIAIEHRQKVDQLRAENATQALTACGRDREHGRVEERCARLRKACAELAEFLTEAEWLQWPELRAELRELGVEAEE